MRARTTVKATTLLAILASCASDRSYPAQLEPGYVEQRDVVAEVYQRPPYTAPDMPPLSLPHDFRRFFAKFMVDTLFQLSHSAKPIQVVVEEVGGRRDTSTYVGGLSFASEAWDGQVILTYSKINPVTVAVLLQIEDTGIHEQHHFVFRDDDWLLISILDKST